jgi:hypothetical protein
MSIQALIDQTLITNGANSILHLAHYCIPLNHWTSDKNDNEPVDAVAAKATYQVGGR